MQQLLHDEVCTADIVLSCSKAILTKKRLDTATYPWKSLQWSCDPSLLQRMQDVRALQGNQCSRSSETDPAVCGLSEHEWTERVAIWVSTLKFSCGRGLCTERRDLQRAFAKVVDAQIVFQNNVLYLTAYICLHDHHISSPYFFHLLARASQSSAISSPSLRLAPDWDAFVEIAWRHAELKTLLKKTLICGNYSYSCFLDYPTSKGIIMVYQIKVLHYVDLLFSWSVMFVLQMTSKMFVVVGCFDPRCIIAPLQRIWYLHIREIIRNRLHLLFIQVPAAVHCSHPM